MATKVIMPKQGLQMVEGTILRWLRHVGDSVKEGMPLLEIETDKTTMAIDAPASGILMKILRKEGETVPIAETIAYIGNEGEDDSAIEEVPETVRGKRGEAGDGFRNTDIGGFFASGCAEYADAQLTRRVFASPRARQRAGEMGLDIGIITGSGPDNLIVERDVLQYAALFPEKPKTTPLARRIAELEGIDLSKLEPRPKHTKIRKEDVLRAAEEKETGEKGVGGQSGYLIPHTSMRRTIARRMRESLSTAAQANHMVDIDCSEMMRLRETYRAQNSKVSFTDIIIKAAGISLRKHRVLNSVWTDEGIFVKNDINIGMAVALEKGLVVPVIRHADSVSLEQINVVTRALIDKANAGKLERQDLEGATFTVTNLGMYGIDRFIAIINQPESAILAVGRILEKPVVSQGAIRIKPMMTLSLSYDHRIIDGAPAARFLSSLRQCLENPYLLI